MSNAAWVCLACRLAVRRPVVYRADVPCPECGKACVHLGTKIPVPPKAKLREWKALERRVQQRQRENAVARDRDSVRWKHSLEREIARLEAMPANKGRARTVALLRKRLARVEGR